MCYVVSTVSVTEDYVWDEVKKQIQKEFGDRNLENNLHMVRECLKRRDHITVFRLDGTYSAKDIDMAILQALLKSECLMLHTLKFTYCLLTF